MKFVIIAMWLVCFSLSPARAQLSKAIMDVGIPCAMEIGVSGDDLTAVKGGSFGGALGLWNCFADCASQKVGIVNADYVFVPDAFKEKLALFVLPERVDEFTEKCKDKVGEGKCKASGEMYHCILNHVLNTLFA